MKVKKIKPHERGGVLKEPSEEAKTKIIEFFLKTSVPRILANERKDK